MSVIKSIAVFLVGFVSLRLSYAQVPLFGACPDVAVKPDFNPNRYLGKWYEVERYFAFFELGGKCVTAQYGEKDNGMITVLNKQLSVFSGVKSMIEGEANQVSRSDVGKLAVRFPSLPFNFAAPYWIIDTDYDNYAVVWSCNDYGIIHTENAWILTRERNPQLTVLEKAYSVLDKNRLNRAYLTRTDQSNCADDDE